MRCAAMLPGLCLSIVACGSSTREDAATWRADCPTLAWPAPLSMEAAREAQRLATRRHELRLREAAAPGSFLHEMHAALDAKRVAAGQVCLQELADLGQLLFEHEFTFADGLGSGESSKAPAGPFRRVHAGLFGGPETISCPSCHWLGGPNGAGAETDTAFLDGDGERTTSGDEQNPPALVALGVVQALAREMSRTRQQQRADLLREAARAGVAREEYLTPRLWGVADSAPYLQDGRAPSFDYAIAGHDGEGAAARAAFEALPMDDRGPLRVYLMSLRRAPRLVVP